MDYSGFDDLLVEVKDGVAVWRINRPEKLNAMRTPTFHEIIKLGQMLKADDDVRAVVATGSGRGFSSGADVSGPAEGETVPERIRAERTDNMGVSAIALAMPGLDKPAIAAVDGVDILLVGGSDLSATMGIPGQFANPDFVDAVGTVIDGATEAGKWAGLGGVYLADLFEKLLDVPLWIDSISKPAR